MKTTNINDFINLHFVFALIDHLYFLNTEGTKSQYSSAAGSKASKQSSKFTAYVILLFLEQNVPESCANRCSGVASREGGDTDASGQACHVWRLYHVQRDKHPFSWCNVSIHC